MPCRARLQGDLETQPAVGKKWLAVVTADADHHAAREVAIAIDRPQLGFRSRPLRDDAPAPHDVLGFDFEDIREVRADGDFQVKARPRGSMIGDVEVFMHAAAERAADRQSQTMPRYRSVLRRN